MRPRTPHPTTRAVARRAGSALPTLAALASLALPGAAAAATYQCAYIGGDLDPAAQSLAPGDVTFDPSTLRLSDRSRWRIDGPFARLLSGQQAVVTWTGPELEIRTMYIPGKMELTFHFNTRTHAGSFEESLVAVEPSVRAFFDADCRRVNVV